MEMDFPYKKEESSVFGKIKRPRIKMNVLSNISRDWITLDEVLADTGADFCMMPRYVGELLVEDITKGTYAEIKGVVPGVKLIAYIHKLKIKLGQKEMTTPIALADSDDVPIIFGRTNALDLFDAIFSRGEKTTLSWS